MIDVGFLRELKGKVRHIICDMRMPCKAAVVQPSLKVDDIACRVCMIAKGKTANAVVDIGN